MTVTLRTEPRADRMVAVGLTDGRIALLLTVNVHRPLFATLVVPRVTRPADVVT
ncbi:hypothetical protein D3C75_1262110 [compost metagenome]